MLRRRIPQRTCTKTLDNYKAYRPYLQSDFGGRCGYCDIDEKIQMIPFHIDHFAPLKYFEELAADYLNLVYACPSCNRAKWDHWPMDKAKPSHDGNRGFIDPCEKEYDDHLERREDGTIVAKTKLGVYILRRLKLYLLRHRYLWLLDKAYEQCKTIQDFIASLEDTDPDVVELKHQYSKLLDHYLTYNRVVRGDL